MTMTNFAVKAPKTLITGAFFAMALAVSGCQTSNSANTVSSSAVGSAMTVRTGTVTTTRAVTIWLELALNSRHNGSCEWQNY